MKWLLAVVAAAGCGTDSSPCRPGSIACLTFEDGALPPDNWTVAQSGAATGEIERTHSHSGARALHIAATPAPGIQWTLQTPVSARGIVNNIVHAYVYVPALPTAEVTLISATNSVDARLDPDGSLVGVGPSSQGVVVHPGQWTEIEVDAGYGSSQMDFATLSVGVQADGTGDPFEIFFDDVGLVEDRSI
jgi:hypothetical protein